MIEFFIIIGGENGYAVKLQMDLYTCTYFSVRCCLLLSNAICQQKFGNFKGKIKEKEEKIINNYINFNIETFKKA